MEDSIKNQIDSLINNNPIMLFMKGSQERPQCGFSKQVVQVLEQLVTDFASFDVLSDPNMREGIKVYSSWPTIPQLYVDGEFIGGCDIVLDLQKSGELAKILKLKTAHTAPNIKLTKNSIAAFHKAIADKNPDEHIRIRINAQFEHELEFDQASPEDFIVTIEGISLIIDPVSALRADLLSVDFMTEDLNSGFVFTNPNAPPAVEEISPEQLAELVKSGSQPLLIDVRPQAEWELAHIDFAQRLENMSAKEIAKLDKSSPIVFHCHHGRRSRHTAESWRLRGFKKLYNLTGGIDAWSRKIDPKVAIYAK